MIKKTSGFFFFWVVLPLLAASALYFLRLGVLAFCFYAFFLLLIAARLMAWLWMRPLGCERIVTQDVVQLGEKVQVFVNLQNQSAWPILWNYIEETLPEKMLKEGVIKRLLFMPPKRQFHLEYSITPTTRGCHRVGPLVLESGDVFGLFKKCRVDKRVDFITALPAYRLIEEFQVGQQRRLGDLAGEKSIFEDPSRLRGVREYQRGDAMKRIHWKASAHSGDLFTKIYDPVLEPGATVALDFRHASWAAAKAREIEYEKPPPEAAIEIACSISRYLSDGGWKIGFFSNGRDPLGAPGLTVAQARAADTLFDARNRARQRKRDDRLEPIHIRASRSPDQFPVIHENLGRVELSDGLPIEELLLGELAHIERQQIIVLITGEATDSFITAVLRAREMGYRLMVFIVCNPVAHDRAYRAFTPHRIDVFDMAEKWRLQEIATGRQSL